jgi:hypothetical protein
MAVGRGIALTDNVEIAMPEIYFQCPGCRGQLGFAPEQAGTTQQCLGCGQQVIVPSQAPGNVPTPVVPRAYSPNIPTQPLFHQEERSREAHTARKLKMGAGCFAMLAVMFAVGLVGWGIGHITDLPDRQIEGWSGLIAGLAGVAAFVFFGYFATETAEKQHDQGRR